MKKGTGTKQNKPPREEIVVLFLFRSDTKISINKVFLGDASISMCLVLAVSISL